jgi:hypothetical protein
MVGDETYRLSQGVGNLCWDCPLQKAALSVGNHMDIDKKRKRHEHVVYHLTARNLFRYKGTRNSVVWTTSIYSNRQLRDYRMTRADKGGKL